MYRKYKILNALITINEALESVSVDSRMISVYEKRKARLESELEQMYITEIPENATDD